MFNHYFNIEQLKQNQYKNIIYYKNSKKLYTYILFSKKELSENENRCSVRYDVLSYGEYPAKIITNFETLKFN